ncbi:MAG: hypothetical protein KC591_13700 [Gemmatimonadetes bacterium]|nr:hypothetical protein [Gemmatimonadota bacterium]
MVGRIGGRARMALAVALAITAGLPGSVRGEDSPIDEKIRVLTEEVRRLRDRIDLPAADVETASGARKVESAPGLSIGGYGEFYYQRPTGGTDATATADLYRIITYVGYKFRPGLLMNTEIEFEHGTTEENFAGREGSVSLEFAYLEFGLSDRVRLRAGNLLLPLGLTNEQHEPPFYRGSIRPAVETSIIPTTWRELGVGAWFGGTGRWRGAALVVNALDAAQFSATGIRGGRQGGNRVLFEDAAVVGVAEVEASPGWWIGTGGTVGNAAQGRRFDGRAIAATTSVVEAHSTFRRRGLEVRALYAATAIDDADAISAALSDSAQTVTVPSRQNGWYVEAAYDIGPHVSLPSGHALRPWARFERTDLQAEVPAGATANPALDASSWTVGVEYFPDPRVVVKADWTFQDNEAGGKTDDPFRLGAGFVF